MFKFIKNFIEDWFNRRRLTKDLSLMSPDNFTEKWFTYPSKIETDIQMIKHGKTDFIKFGERQTGKTYYVTSLISYLVLQGKLDYIFIMSFSRENSTRILHQMLNNKLHYLLTLLKYKQKYKSKEKIIYDNGNHTVSFEVKTFNKDFGRGELYTKVFLFADEIKKSPLYNFTTYDTLSRTLGLISENHIFYETVCSEVKK